MSNIIYHPLFLLFAVLLAPFTNAATLATSSPLITHVKEGQIVAKNDFLYRKLIKITDKGYYLVQNFYQNTHQKQTDAFIIKNPKHLSTFQPIDIYNLKDLIFDGDLTLWFVNGTKYMSMHIDNGEAKGTFNRYYPTGSPEIVGQYNNGKPDGLWYYWDTEGQLEKKVYFKTGIKQWQKDTVTLKGL